jgi:hypothetical protein
MLLRLARECISIAALNDPVSRRTVGILLVVAGIYIVLDRPRQDRFFDNFHVLVP